MNHNDPQVILETLLSAICVITGVLAVLAALQWSGVWPAFRALGEFMLWLGAQPGPLGFVMWLGFFFALGSLMLVAIRVTRRALFRG